MASPSPSPDGEVRTIAQVAEEFGVTHRAVRHYEDHGLITPERRGTQRLYHARDRVRLDLVLRGRRLGFALDEIARIVDMYDETPGEAGQLTYLLERIEERRRDLLARRADIDATLTELDGVAERCRRDLAGLGGGAATLTRARSAGTTDGSDPAGAGRGGRVRAKGRQRRG